MLRRRDRIAVRIDHPVLGTDHVGRALMPLLTSLPCRGGGLIPESGSLIWHTLARKIFAEESVGEIYNLPAGNYCIVIIHNQQHDPELFAVILKRNDFMIRMRT